MARRLKPNRIQFSRWTPLAGSALVEFPEKFTLNPLSAPALAAYLNNPRNQSKQSTTGAGTIANSNALSIPDGGTVEGAGGFHGAQVTI